MVARRGRPPKKCLTATAVDSTQEGCSHVQDKTTAQDKTVVDKQEGHIGCSESESTDSGTNVNHVLVETTAVDCGDALDIPSGAVTIGSLDNGTLYVLRPLDSAVGLQSAQGTEYRTLRLLSRADGNEGEATATPTVLVAASSADVISGSADLAHFLRSAGIADFRPEPATQSASTT